MQDEEEKREGRTEGELLKGLARGFGEEEVDEDDLEREEDNVGDVVFPAGIADTDGVDELVEEAGATTPPLEDGDTLSTNVVGEDLDQVG